MDPLVACFRIPQHTADLSPATDIIFTMRPAPNVSVEKRKVIVGWALGFTVA